MAHVPLPTAPAADPHLSVSPWICLSAGLTSTKCISSASRNALNPFVARIASAASVPRPGPSSTKTILAGRPMLSQRVTAQMPMSSPNIWDTSGEVTKSPVGGGREG